MAETEIASAAWLLPFTVADQMLIDALDERVRDVVERYARNGVSSIGQQMTDEELIDSIADAVVDSLNIRYEVSIAVRDAMRKHRA